MPLRQSKRRTSVARRGWHNMTQFYETAYSEQLTRNETQPFLDHELYARVGLFRGMWENPQVDCGSCIYTVLNTDGQLDGICYMDLNPRFLGWYSHRNFRIKSDRDKTTYMVAGAVACYVKPHFTRQGIGSGLLQRTEQYFLNRYPQFQAELTPLMVVNGDKLHEPIRRTFDRIKCLDHCAMSFRLGGYFGLRSMRNCLINPDGKQEET